MWKKINALPEPASKRSNIELINNDNTIFRNVRVVINRGRKDISRLCSGLGESSELALDDGFLEQVSLLKGIFSQKLFFFYRFIILKLADGTIFSPQNPKEKPAEQFRHFFTHFLCALHTHFSYLLYSIS